MKKVFVLALALVMALTLVGCGLQDHGTPLAPPVEELTQEELYARAGDLLPSEGPEGFTLTYAGYSELGYDVLWSKGTNELNWLISEYKEEDAPRITSVEDTENYDLSLYPVPHSESVPKELQNMVSSPIFRAEELTQAAVSARASESDEPGDSGTRMHFSLLYGDKMVSIWAKGVSPEWLYEQLAALFDPWGITMTAVDVVPTGMTLLVTQTNGAPTGELGFGCEYGLEMMQDGDWRPVPYAPGTGDVAWTAELYIVRRGGSTGQAIHWENLYGELPKGQYRLLKTIQDHRGPGDRDTKTYYAEFTIE